MPGPGTHEDRRNRGAGAGSPDANPGVHARNTDLLDVDVRVSDPETGPRAHRTLLDAGLDELLLGALAELPGERIGDKRALLEEHGVDALDGHVAAALATAAGAIDAADELDLEIGADGIVDEIPEDAPAMLRGADPIDEALELLRSLGSGMTSTGLPTSTDDVLATTPALLAASTSTPTIAVEISGAFFDRDREQRVDVLELLVELGLGCRVVLDTTTLAARRLYTQHRAELPAHVTARLDPGRAPPAHAADGLPQRVEELVEDARQALDPDGAEAAVLRAVRDAQGDALSYADLSRQLAITENYGHQLGMRLEELGLAERIDRTDGRTVVSMLPAGVAILRRWRLTRGEQAALPDVLGSPSAAGGDRASRRRYDPPKNSLPCRVNPQTSEDPPSGSADAAADAAAEGDRTDLYAHGAISLGWMDRARHAAVAGSARSGEISLVNAELEGMLEHCGDGREPAWSYDSSEDVLAVGAEYHNPMQWWVAIARALSAPRTWRRVLDEDRVGEQLEELATSDVELLQDARCIGWLPEDATEDRDVLVDELLDAHQELLEVSAGQSTGEYEDRDNHRSETLKLAMGLAGTMSHLLDLADVEVVRELRIPQFSDKFSRNGHADRRRDLRKTVAIGAAISSRYGHYAAYRQLLEDRPKKIEQALDPHVDASNPLAELHGSIVISGHGVEDLEDELRRTVERPKDLRPDAPEIAARIPVRIADSPATTRRVARAMGSAKNLDVGRRAIAALHGFSRSPYAVADALAALETEANPRELFLDELRVALGSLEDDRLLPDGARSARDGLLALLRAGEPISQAELARRAEISTQSWRNHRDVLEAAGLVEETPEGWRCTLPFASERYEDDLDVVDPWILDVDGVGWGGQVRIGDVLEAGLVDELDLWGDPLVEDALAYKGPPVDELLEAIGAGILHRFVEVLLDVESDPPAALLGPELGQLSIYELERVTAPPKNSYEAD